MSVQPEDIVRSGPNRYICQDGILKNFAEFIEGFTNPTIVTGFKSYQAFIDYVEAVPNNVTVIQHDGYSSPKAIKDIASKVSQADVIIGIGGGIILDTAKSVADQLEIEFMTIPTVAGTCAAATPLSAIYTPDGAFLKVAYHTNSSSLTLIDPAFLINAPITYLKSGIGDTLAKWYEAEAIIRYAADEKAQSLMVQAGLNQSVYLRDILLEDGNQAVKSSERGEVTPAFTKVIEAIIMLSGTVGGFAGRYGRIAGAHAIHNGLSYINETHHILHGHKVAYGILVQLAIEKRVDEITSLVDFYTQLDFPTKFTDLGITTNQTKARNIIAEHAINPKESLQLMGDFSTKDVIIALDYLENNFR
ncbi:MULTISPECIES: iron-containing alcohol dehydrogenase family protein [Paraliobacillus]|uniref:iron-containing alcohol dehydrogenase family protein n=1 Tax=Paraliobacillus TaxID=200903 RepID=UPI000DD39C0F|nr:MULTISPECIES: iron-containing alcohol dehydrogenase family protein [Paraliobacillus]